MADWIYKFVITIIDWLVQTTWQSGVLLLVVIGILMLFHRMISPRWRCVMWLMVFARLIMPIQPQSPVSLYSLFSDRESLNIPQNQASDYVTTISYETPVASGQKLLPIKESLPSVESGQSLNWRIYLFGGWAVGAIICWGWMIVSQYRFACSIQSLHPVSPEVLKLFEQCCQRTNQLKFPRLGLTDQVSGPSVHGMINPTILIPMRLIEELSPDQLRYVFMHELMHIQRHDILIESIALLIRGLHWFNPVAYIAISRLRSERELACDDLVLRQAGDDHQIQYGQTVLYIAARSHRSSRPVLAMASGKSSLKRRITMISHFKSRKWSNMLPLLLLLIIASCTMTDAQTTQKSESPESQKSAKSKYSYSHNRLDDGTLLVTDPQSPVENGKIGPIKNPSQTVLLQATDELDDKLHVKLQSRIPEIRFQEVAFDDAVEFFRDTQKLNLFVNWKALERSGIDRKALVTMRMSNVTLAKALNILLTEVSGGQDVLAYNADRDVITITTREDIGQSVESNTYDIRDLIIHIPDVEITDPKKPATQPAGPTRDELVEQITNLIRETIGVGSWKEDGGQLGSIRELGGQLIVTQSPENHRQIVQLLSKLRDQRSLQITVEGRILSIDISKIPDDKRANFFNLENAPKKGESNVAYLDDKSVKEFLDLIKLDPASSTLSTPRLTIFNGQRAAVEVAREVNYVTSFKRDDNKEWKPVIDTVKSGMRVALQGTISADRKYVTLTLHSKVTKLIQIDTYKFNTSDSDASNLFAQLPVVETSDLQTSSSTPDGKTLMLSGLSFSRGPQEPNQMLVFLFKPTIIIQREVEQETFPRLSSQPWK